MHPEFERCHKLSLQCDQCSETNIRYHERKSEYIIRIWFGSVAPSPIITCMMHDEKGIKQLLAWSFRQRLVVLKFVLRQTDQPRYRLQDGLWRNHKNLKLENQALWIVRVKEFQNAFLILT